MIKLYQETKESKQYIDKVENLKELCEILGIKYKNNFKDIIISYDRKIIENMKDNEEKLFYIINVGSKIFVTEVLPKFDVKSDEFWDLFDDKYGQLNEYTDDTENLIAISFKLFKILEYCIENKKLLFIKDIINLIRNMRSYFIRILAYNTNDFASDFSFEDQIGVILNNVSTKDSSVLSVIQDLLEEFNSNKNYVNNDDESDSY